MQPVRIVGLKKVFSGGIIALDGIDLEVGEGEFLVLLGPSGCGKTTLLRVIAGLEDATEGEVWIGESRVDALPPQKRNLAMVFQNYALYPHMTVRGNLAFGLRMRGMGKGEIAERVLRTARTLDITELLDRKPRTLSGGQMQRVALGRALVRDPEAFLMDEPLSNLDARLRLQMRAELIRLHNRFRRTTVYVTHDQAEAMTMGGRIAVMDRGRILQVGNPMDVYLRPAHLFVARFIGSPPMGFIEGNLRLLDDRALFEAPSLELTLPKEDAPKKGGRLLLGIRPEDVVLDEGGMAAVAEVAEPLGSETILTIRVGDSRLYAKAPPERGARSGQTVHVRFNRGKAHFFDPETEERLN